MSEITVRASRSQPFKAMVYRQGLPLLLFAMPYADAVLFAVQTNERLRETLNQLEDLTDAT